MVTFFRRRISLFSRLIPFKYCKGGEIEDDWEYVEVHPEFVCEKNDTAFIQGEDTESVDQGEPNFLTFPSLHHSNSDKIKYSILSKDDVRQSLEDRIIEVSTVLLLQKNEAALILQHFKWDVIRTFDEWLECEEKVRKEVGLLVRPVADTLADAAEIACRICHADFPRDALLSVSCGHQICHSCWEGYISEAINDEQCVTLRCPEPSCDAAVGLYFIKGFLSKDDDKKFENHLLRSYLACSNEGKLCPASDCNYAVLSFDGGEGNVTCRCLHSFCWSCSGEAHAPVDCFTLTRWISERVSKSEEWLLANTTSCLKCRVASKERSYVYHEICISCGHEYCSICGDEWNKNGTEGYESHETHACNADSGLKGLFKKSLERYNNYYTKWATCESSRANTLTDLKLLQELRLELLCGIFGISPEELDFLAEALLQVAECWQFLKWTHVYGYYLPANEEAKKHLLEFMQEKATDLVGQLEKHVEELQNSVDKDFPYARFLEFRSKIPELTRVVKNYFDHMMDGLKSGLSEVACSTNPNPGHKLSRDREEKVMNVCPEPKPNPSHMCPKSTIQRMDICPIAKVMRGVGDMDISKPVSRPKSADMLVEFS